MAPTKSSPHPSSSQNKKQQSISSFFAPKGASTSKPSKPVPIVPPSNIPAEEDDEDEEQIAIPHRTTSSHSKRAIDDANSDEENQEPSPKRVRQTLSNATAASSRIVVNERQKKDHVSVDEGRAEGLARSKVPTRTSKYIFSSPPQPGDDDEDNEESIRRKEALHNRFVQKLGAPDSLAEIKRRRWNNTEGDGDNGEEEDEDEPTSKSTKGKKGGARANGKLTPMEVQFLDIKRKHMDTIIAYQVGYKYRFFGEDARVAAKELGIFCVPGKFRFDEREYC